jgi:flagellar capping protein FliD
VTGAANPVTLTVGAPGPDKNAIAAKVKGFVDQYNSTISFIRSKLDEKPVPNATTAADQNKACSTATPLCPASSAGCASR